MDDSTGGRLRVLLNSGPGRDESARRLSQWSQSEAALSKAGRLFLSRPQLVARAIAVQSKLLEERRNRGLGAESRDWEILSDLQGEVGPAQIHDTVFLPALRYLCSESQAKRWIPMAEEYAVFGCYAQTELAHGSNVGGLQTLAIYDAKADRFRLHTPVVSAVKWWVGALGCCATHAIVWARLIVPARSQADASGGKLPRGARRLASPQDPVLAPVLSGPVLDVNPEQQLPLVTPHSLTSELLHDTDQRHGREVREHQAHAASSPSAGTHGRKPSSSDAVDPIPTIPRRHASGVETHPGPTGGDGPLPVHPAVRAALLAELPRGGARTRHTDGTRHTGWIDLGPHPFLLQIRCTRSLQLFPGIVAGDIGPKLGMEAVDNGYMALQGAVATRDALLGGAGAVDPKGGYTPPRQRRRAFAGMLAARSQIIARSAPALSVAAAVALRYSAHREQFGPPGSQGSAGTGVGSDSDPDPPMEWAVLRYPSQHRRVMGAVFAAVSMRTLCPAVADRVRAVGSSPSANLRNVHSLLSVLKPYTTEAVSSLIETCRRCCGGHGYSSMGGIAGLWATYVHVTTAEGDNYVLAQQAMRGMLAAAQSDRIGPAVDSAGAAAEGAADATRPQWMQSLHRFALEGIGGDSGAFIASSAMPQGTSTQGTSTSGFLSSHLAYLRGLAAEEDTESELERAVPLAPSHMHPAGVQRVQAACGAVGRRVRDLALGRVKGASHGGELGGVVQEAMLTMLTWLAAESRCRTRRVAKAVMRRMMTEGKSQHRAFVSQQPGMMPAVMAHGAVVEVAALVQCLGRATRDITDSSSTSSTRSSTTSTSSRQNNAQGSKVADTTHSLHRPDGESSSSSSSPLDVRPGWGLSGSALHLLQLAALGRALALVLEHCSAMIGSGTARLALSGSRADFNESRGGRSGPTVDIQECLDRSLTTLCSAGATAWSHFDTGMGVSSHTAGTPLYGRSPGYGAMLRWASLAPLNRGVGLNAVRGQVARVLAEGRRALKKRLGNSRLGNKRHGGRGRGRAKL